MLKLYESFVVPIMFYGCEIWGFEEDADIERVQLWILKYILHVPVSTPTKVRSLSPCTQKIRRKSAILRPKPDIQSARARRLA